MKVQIKRLDHYRQIYLYMHIVPYYSDNFARIHFYDCPIFDLIRIY